MHTLAPFLYLFGMLVFSWAAKCFRMRRELYGPERRRAIAYGLPDRVERTAVQVLVRSGFAAAAIWCGLQILRCLGVLS